MTEYRRMLVPVDFSDASREAVRRSGGLARKLGADLVLLHVLDPPAGTGLLRHAAPPPPEITEVEEKACLDRLARLAAGAESAGLRVERRLRRGPAVEEILGEVKASGADLLVVGSHGRTGLARAVLGSVAELLLRRSPVPVLVVRSPEAAEGPVPAAGGETEMAMDSYERILVPVDFSAPSREAARRALSLARCMDSEVQFLHVIDDRQIAMVPGNLVPVAEFRDPGLTDSTLKRLDEFVRGLDSTGIRVGTRVRMGAPFDEILLHADEWKPSLIVMGTHGRTGLSRAVLGSQAELVVRRARVPVLVVHAPDDGKEAKRAS